MDIGDKIDKIMKQLSALMETSGISRSVCCVTIVKMLEDVQTTFKQRELEFQKEKNDLLAHIDQLTKRDGEGNGN